MLKYDYEDFKRAVYQITGFDLNSYKERQMKRRIDVLIARNGFSDYREYVGAIKSDQRLLDEFVNYLTINVSEFYRNPKQWEVLEYDFLPELLKSGRINVWSAACSTGEEPYSMVMLLSKYLPLSKIKVLATDIDERAILRAKEGIYREQSLIGLPREFIEKYFTPLDGARYAVKDEVKKCVEFKKHDLLADEYPQGYNLILCRNVVIYFTEQAKDYIYKHFYKSLADEGILFVGCTEQIMNYRELGYMSPVPFFYVRGKQ